MMLKSYRLHQVLNRITFSFHRFSVSIEPNTFNKTLNPQLSQQELTQINLLIPRLCYSDDLTTAIQLTTTVLLTNPPPGSLSLSTLIHSLTSLPDLTRPMSLLTQLRHTRPAHPHLTPITGMLIKSYMKKGRFKDALKIYNWVRRPGSVCEVESAVYGVLVGGFCEGGLIYEGLKVLRDMVKGGLMPGDRLRNKLVRCFLKEARVNDARELDRALRCLGDGACEDGVEKVLVLLDQMISNWTD